MGESTSIAWTDATVNWWIGCTKVENAPACVGCYAAAQDVRWNGGEHWGHGAPRRRTSDKVWGAPLKWDALRKAGATEMKGPKGSILPVPLWVFTLSLGDFFDNEVPPEWRMEAFRVIQECTSLRWQIVTKRSAQLPKMIPSDGWFRWNRHVGVIITVVTQAEADRDIPRLLRMKAEHGIKWVGLSIEPQVAHIALQPQWFDPGGLDWVICGGASKQAGYDPPPFDIDWARSLVKQCGVRDTPFFMKQIGSNPYSDGRPMHGGGIRRDPGSNPAAWPADIRVREMPRVYD